MASGGVAAEVARLVVAHVDADGEVGREAEEPDVLLVVGGAGLAGDRLGGVGAHPEVAALDAALHRFLGHRCYNLVTRMQHADPPLLTPTPSVPPRPPPPH